MSSTAALLVLSAALASGNALARPWFPQPIKLLSSDALGLAAADLNNDGHVDVVVPGKDWDEIWVHLGNGDGSFTTLDGFYSDDGPIDAAVADFNEDGNPDLALAKASGDGGVSVLMGNGDGTFGSETDYAPVPGPALLTSVSVGDFNGDDVPDLLAVGSGGLAFLGNGDGTFEVFVVPGADSFHSVGVADFDGDDLDDYASPEQADIVKVYLSNGNGTFAFAGSFPVGDYPKGVAAGDVSEDGIPDLVAANSESNDISVLLGNGDGTFGPEQRYGLGVPPAETLQPTYIAIDDLDGDGLQDLVVANWWSAYPTPSLSLLYGTGGGQFSDAVTADRMRGFALEIAIADFDEDGSKDVVRSCMNGSWVSWLFGDGHGAFVTNRHEEVGESLKDVAVGELNGDGRLDLVTANEDSDDVSVLLADGAGTFSPEQRSCVVDAIPPCPPGSDPAALALAEMTGDAHADLAVANSASDTVSILAGDGAGGFSFVSSLTLTAGTSPSSIAIGDFDGDAEPDLVVAGEGSIRLTVFLGNGDGTFVAPPGLPAVVGTEPSSIVVEDFDGDEIQDLAVSNFGSGTVSVLLGTGNGSFTHAPSLDTFDGGPLQMAVGDVNNDLKPDLAIVNAIPSGPVCAKPAEVFLGNGDGTFSSPIGTAYFHGSTIDILDVNGDGQLELVGSNPISVWLGNGDGVFDVMGYYTGSGPSVAGGDFNLDGRTDLAVAYGSALILLNLSGPTALTFEADRMTLVWPAVTGALSYDIYRGDASVLVDGDDDGLPDSGYGACMTALDDDPRDTFFVDAETPSEGEGFFYLISVIDAHGDGGIGTTSDGLPRLPQVPCP